MSNTDDTHTNGTRKPNDTDPSDAAGLPQNRENDTSPSDAAGLPQNREGRSPTPRPSSFVGHPLTRGGLRP